MSRAAEFSRADLATLALRRYARLTVPSLVACLFALVCLSLFPTAANDLGVATGHTFLAVTNGALDTNILRFLRTTLIDLYRGGVVELDPPLWTMRVELFGSLGIYLLVRLVPRSWQALLAVAATLFFLRGGGAALFYAAFPIGFLWRARLAYGTSAQHAVSLAVAARGRFCVRW